MSHVSPTTGLLRYRADVRTIGILTAFAALSMFAWFVNPSGVAAVAMTVVLCANAWLCAIIAHNTVHTPVFTKRWLNRVFQVWVSLSYGFPISEYVPGHNLSHHRYLQERADVMRTSKVHYRWNLLNFLLFFFHVGPGVTLGNYRYKRAMAARDSVWNRQLTAEIIAVWGVKALLVAIDWRRAILFVVVPHLFAVWGITTVNFVQHDGCDENHPVNHSRNFVGGFFNWLTVNNGYHGIHHMHPGLHWSLLPAAHAAEVKPTLDPRLDEPSLAKYLFRAFIWPGKRVRFDGTPAVVPPVGADIDWVAQARGSQTRAESQFDDTNALTPG